jgi:hypothetical protein
MGLLALAAQRATDTICAGEDEYGGEKGCPGYDDNLRGVVNQSPESTLDPE